MTTSQRLLQPNMLLPYSEPKPNTIFQVSTLQLVIPGGHRLAPGSETLQYLGFT